ncbi:vascular endothelial growth factor A-like [Arctopsyche grandis]|uniref:vascular endothelial growth factor A-like n=1 Tax=Arctopsyche grandis TaxID=121162 RepID=UPI00406D82B6
MAIFFGVLVVIACFSVMAVVDSKRSSNSRVTDLNYDAIVFPDTFGDMQRNFNERRTLKNTRNSTISQMSLEMAKSFNDVDNIDDFLNRHLDNKNDYYNAINDNPFIVGARFGFETKGRSGVLPFAKSANCMPELTVVPLFPEGTENSGVFHLPSCTRVLRCGGCCNNALLSCEPTDIGRKQFRIYELTQNGNSPHYKKFINVTLEEHLKCKCDCTIKEKDCKGHQVYNANECRCVCRDIQAELRCSNQNDRYWNSSTCSCECIELSECSTGTYFDDQSCSCKRR